MLELLNEILQWIFIGLIFWSSNHLATATSQLQKLAKRSLDQEVDKNMKHIHETETFQ